MVVTNRDTIAPAPALMKRVSWGAIFAGAVSAVALTALLSLLGLGIGFGAVDPEQSGAMNDVPKVTLAWWAVTSIIATGIGGFVAARLAGIPRSMTGALHGLAVWAVATLVTLWLATSAVGTVLGAAGSVVSTTARTAGSVVGTVGGAAIDAGGAVAPSGDQVADARSQVEREAQEIASSAGIGQSNVEAAEDAVGQAARNAAMQPGQAGEELDLLIDRLFEGPDAALSPQDRDRLIDEIAARGGLSRGEAEDVADRWQAQANSAGDRAGTTFRQVRTRAGEVSGDVFDALSVAAWGMFLISLAGLIASLLGAALGAPSLGSVGATGTIRDDDFDDDRDHAATVDRS